MSGPGSTILLIARQELALASRSRWTQVFAAVFATLAATVSASGYLLSGGQGFQKFARTSASLLQLVVLLAPLAALVMGVLELVPERSAAEVLFSQPIPRRSVLLGKLAGLFAALAGAQLIGFGVAGLVVFSSAGGEGAAAYALLVLGSLVLTAVFLALAALIAAGAVGRKRTRSLAVALVVWMVAAILLDLLVLGVASLLPSGDASRLLAVSVLVNPSTAVRVGALLGIKGTTAFGPATLAFLRLTGGPARAGALLLVSIAAWIVLPILAAGRRLSRLDL